MTRPTALVPGLATGIGSLPHLDIARAVDVSLTLNPELPALPQLPDLEPREGLINQWVGALPEVAVARDGSLLIDAERMTDPVNAGFDSRAHGGLFGFFDVCAERGISPARVKGQIVGPLTLGVALQRAGMAPEVAFPRAAAAVRAWIHALEDVVAQRLPASAFVLFLDEPSLVLWRAGNAPLEREPAVDLLSGTLTASSAVTGVHVCGDGDLRLAFEAGPDILGVTVSEQLADDADVIVRHLDADGFVAWGAVPTDRPLGDSADGLWRDLVTVWCDLTRRGCEPLRLRTQAIITPACGLAGHGPSQAERVLRLTRAIAQRVGDQAVAARLTVGA